MADDPETFDYVIVGAGSSGSLLTNRLSEDGRTTVCLIEAGNWDTHPLIHVPAGFLRLNSHPDLAWPFASEPTDLTAGRSIRLPQGKVVGGSSSINGMVYNRGQPADFDAWRDLGNPGWGYDDVLPAFRRTERRIGRGSPVRGGEGALPVTDHDRIDPVSEAFLDGLAEFGIGRNDDYNSGEQDGAGYFQRTIDRGYRVSAARAFLHPARNRANVSVRTGLRADRVIVEDGRARGVAWIGEKDRSRTGVLNGRKGVILCAGALNTPSILMRSGIGRAGALRDIGIETLVDLPGVGESLKDHYAVRVVSSARNVSTINEHSRGWRLGREIVRWMAGRPSILALTPSLAYVFARSPLSAERTDIQFVFTPGSYETGRVYSLAPYPGMTCGFCQQRPESAGHVRLRSADPFDLPIVQPNYLADELDRATALEGLRMVRRFLSSRSLARYFEAETLPGDAAQSDADLLDFARQYGITSFHYCGTARMGPSDDPTAVVDARLNVRGIGGLRIADASIMPNIPSANTYASTLMIAERAAQFLTE